jgi:hypothetical protein
MIVDDWAGCYPSSWKGLIVPEAIVHPAKSSVLSDHVAFMAKANNGDSRNLAQLIEPANASVSSPPYSVDALGHAGKPNEIDAEKKLYSRMAGASYSGLVSSPPYAESLGDADKSGIDWSKQADRDTTHPHGWNGSGYSGAVSSPPYSDSLEKTNGIDASKIKSAAGPNSQALLDTKYGATPGQLGSMKAQGFEAAIQSDNSRINSWYGEDFWLASRAIVDQVYQVLLPGGHACWVVKDFVKNKERVPFCDQWRQLCEAAGFVTLHEHHAMLVHGKQIKFDGSIQNKESKSFFRRLSEKKSAINNYWKSLAREDVEIFMPRSRDELWGWYNGLTDQERSEKLTDGVTYLHPQPTPMKILEHAKEMAFDERNDKGRSWNADTRIDYETVFCMVKP